MAWVGVKGVGVVDVTLDSWLNIFWQRLGMSWGCGRCERIGMRPFEKLAEAQPARTGKAACPPSL